jgi:hypothetical protein
VRQFIPATNTPARVHLLEAGRWPVHHDFRMRIDLKDVPPRPAALARVFEAAGMRVVRQTERWEKVLGV